MTRTSQVAVLEGASKQYGYNGTRITALHAVSLRVRRGELVLLLGPSGSGKTTLLSLLAGLLEPSSGEVRLFGRALHEYSQQALQQLRARHIGFVFQNFLLLEPLTVRQNIDLVRSFTDGMAESDRDRTDHALTLTGIRHKAEMYPGRLSQGEKQRAAIARALVNDAELLLADEPTASLESSQGADIIRLLHLLAKDEDRAVVVASHDLRLVECADRIIHLIDGSLVQADGRPAS